MANISINRISEDDFLNMRTTWNDLLERSVTNEFFLLWEWVSTWWKSFSNKNRELYLLLGRNTNGELIGLAPFYLEKNNSPFGTTLRFCSSLETDPDHLDLICGPEYTNEFVLAIFAYLAKNKKDWDVIKLEGVKEDSIINNYVISHEDCLENDFIISRLPESECPCLPIVGSFDTFLKSFSSKQRHNVLRRCKILFENENATLRTSDSPNQFDKDAEEFFKLHIDRAERKGVRTKLSGERIYNFHLSFMKQLLEHGKIVLCFLYKQSVPLAASYCIKHKGKYYYYQTAVSLEGEEKSAGIVLLSMMIEKAFEEKYVEFDFLRGGENYKYFWTNKFRMNLSITIRKKDFMGILSSKTMNGYLNFKKLFKLLTKGGNGSEGADARLCIK